MNAKEFRTQWILDPSKEMVVEHEIMRVHPDWEFAGRMYCVKDSCFIDGQLWVKINYAMSAKTIGGAPTIASREDWFLLWEIWEQFWQIESVHHDPDFKMIIV